MTRNLKVSLLLAAMLVVLGATSTQACHRRRACQPEPCCQQGYAYAAPTACCSGSAQSGYVATNGVYTGGGYPGGVVGYPGGYGRYDFGRPGYNPGGLGGPWSGLGVRPGLGFGGIGLGR